MPHIAEFEKNGKIHFWNGEKFIKACITGLSLNPITKIVEYRIFYREGSSAKRSRVSLTTTPYFIKESKHFKDPHE